jgi:hypothetical protein
MLRLDVEHPAVRRHRLKERDRDIFFRIFITLRAYFAWKTGTPDKPQCICGRLLAFWLLASGFLAFGFWLFSFLALGFGA